MEILVKNIVLKSNDDVEVAFLYKLGPIYEELKEKNVKITVFNNTNNVITMARNIKKYCKDHNIDIINVHDGGLKSLLIYYIILKTTKLKIIRTVHSDEIEAVGLFINNKIKKKITYMLMKTTMKLSTKVICVSKAVEKSIKEAFKLKNTVVIYNGIDEKNILEEFSTNKKVPNNNIVFVGRLSKVKGVDILIDAINIIKEKHNTEIQLRIVGDGEERENLELKVKEYKLQNQIKFEGFQKGIYKYLDTSNIFVYPSTWNEAFGISVVEAMGRGCIPIAFNKGGLPEIIEDNKNGFLVKDVNGVELAEVLIKVLNMPNKIVESIRKNAVQTAQKITLNETVRKIEMLYKEIEN